MNKKKKNKILNKFHLLSEICVHIIEHKYKQKHQYFCVHFNVDFTILNILRILVFLCKLKF